MNIRTEAKIAMAISCLLLIIIIIRIVYIISLSDPIAQENHSREYSNFRRVEALRIEIIDDKGRIYKVESRIFIQGGKEVQETVPIYIPSTNVRLIRCQE